MKTCFVPDCTHKSGVNECSFHAFPRTPSRRRRWVKQIRRGDRLPNIHDAVCSCHFEHSQALTPKVFRRDPRYAYLFETPQGKKRKLSNVRKKLLSPSEPDLLSPRVSHKKMKQTSVSTQLVYPLEVASLSDSPTRNQMSVINEATKALEESEDLAIPLDMPDSIADNASNFDFVAERTVNFSPRTSPSVLRKSPSSGKSATTPLSSVKSSHSKKMAEGRRLIRTVADQLVELKKTVAVMEQEREFFKQISLQKDSAINALMLEKTANGKEIESLKKSRAAVEKELEELKDKHEGCEAVFFKLSEKCINSSKLESQLVNKEEELKMTRTEMCTALRAQLEATEKLQEEKERLLIENVSCLDYKVAHYTGLPNYSTFKLLLTLFDSYTLQYRSCRVDCLSRENQLLLTLMRLRLGATRQTLADWFNVSMTTVTNIFLTWLSALHIVVFKGIMGTVPSLAKVQCTLPACFKPFPTCRMVLDCTEVPRAVPKSMRHHNLTYSNYKHRTTLKGCVGIAPNGTIVFASKMYPGSTSDKVVVENSKISEVFNPGESVMVDKGFLIGDLLKEGVHLIRPPFKTTPQFTAQQVTESKQISQARVHVERAIERVKKYRILDFIPPSLVPHASEVFQVCCALTNFRRPLLAEVAESLEGRLVNEDEEED